MRQDYKKATVSIRYWLLGKGYHNALKAMEFAARYHKGTRKDKVTPEFLHQIEQSQLLRTLHSLLLFPEETFCALFLHDVPEDYDVSIEEITLLFGKRVGDAVWRLTKKFRGMVKDEDQLFEEMARCPIASVEKILDRINNVSSMDGVFSYEKQRDYLDFAESRILPMAKRARRHIPEQEAVYENLSYILKQQIALFRALHRDVGLVTTPEATA